MTDLRDEVEDLAICDRSDRMRLRITGPDRARFLHNLTTNNVLTLQPGQGLETFVTSPQGKTLGYVTLHAGEQEILLRSDPGALEPLRPHFEKYGVFDDVSWSDLTADTFELHLFGRALPALMERLAVAELPEAEFRHRSATIGDQPVQIIRENPTGHPGVSVLGPNEGRFEVESTLNAVGAGLGLSGIDPSRFDVLRIEAGTPVFGRDITPANLPQEIDRNDRAICFTKGCYLGQEPVARIDALGHVNKLLRGLQFGPGPVPPAGTELMADRKVVGTVTSSGFSGRLGTPIGLGFVRRTHGGFGQVLRVGGGSAEITATVVPFPWQAGAI